MKHFGGYDEMKIPGYVVISLGRWRALDHIIRSL